MTVLTFVGFGLHAAVSYYRYVKADEGYTQWSAKYNEARATCELAPNSYPCRSTRSTDEFSLADIRNMYRRSSDENMEAFETSFIVALVIPFVSAFIFFLTRWIFTGRWRRTRDSS